MFLYPALYEFICVQSPHAMKGMLIGFSLIMKCPFQLLGFAINALFLIMKPNFLNLCNRFL